MVVEEDHQCYIKGEEIKLNKFRGYIFFDYETYLNESMCHVPNLILASRVCENCLDKKNTSCNVCKLFKFYTNDEFCYWLLSQT